jgi:hypothetical protein
MFHFLLVLERNAVPSFDVCDLGVLHGFYSFESVLYLLFLLSFGQVAATSRILFRSVWLLRFS